MKTPTYDHPPVYAESAATASYRRNLSGWVSRRGHYYGADEDGARRDGADVRLCPTDPTHGTVHVRGYCEECRRLNEEERWLRLPKPAEFDDTFGYFLFDDDTYFRDIEEVQDYAWDNELTEVRLVLAQPCYMQLDNTEQFSDLVPEDGGVDCKLLEADAIIADANEKLKALGPISYEPGKIGYLHERELDPA